MSDVQFKVGDLVVFKKRPNDPPQIVLAVDGVVRNGVTTEYIRTKAMSRLSSEAYRRPSPVVIAKYRCKNERGSL